MSRKTMVGIVALTAFCGLEFLAVQSVDAQLFRRGRRSQNCCTNTCGSCNSACNSCNSAGNSCNTCGSYNASATVTSGTPCSGYSPATAISVYTAPVSTPLVSAMPLSTDSNYGCATTASAPIVSAQPAYSYADSSNCGGNCSDGGSIVSSPVYGDMTGAITPATYASSDCVGCGQATPISYGEVTTGGCGSCGSMVSTPVYGEMTGAITPATYTSSDCVGCGQAAPISYGEVATGGCDSCGGNVVEGGTVIEGCVGGDCGGSSEIIYESAEGGESSDISFEAPTTDATEVEDASGEVETVVPSTDDKEA